MISDEYMTKAAARMECAADRAQDAANRMEEAARRIAHLLEDGYGGRGLQLIELLEKFPVDDLLIFTRIFGSLKS
jgi:hypothetical protein